MDLSIVVVTWNTRELVLDCLAELVAQLAAPAAAPPLAAEILVVDNGSRDGTAAAVRGRFPAARLLALPVNLGFAAGCNAGLRAARGRHVLLLNSDARATREALVRCVQHLDAHADVGVVGPQLLHPDGRLQNSIHSFPSLATELIPTALRELLAPRRFPSKRSVAAAPVEVEAVKGAAIFARAAAVRAVGPLPEEYFFFLEETEWCRRMRAGGWRVVHLPTARVVHVSGASSKRRQPALTRIEYHRSLYRFLRANRGTGSMAMVLSWRLLKSLFYAITQAPLALLGERGRARWKVHRDVLVWHLRGCPRSVGLANADAPVEGRSRSAVSSA